MNAARSVDGWRSLFWTAFNLSANPMLLLQPDRVLAGANDAFLKSFGYTRARARRMVRCGIGSGRESPIGGYTVTASDAWIEPRSGMSADRNEPDAVNDASSASYDRLRTPLMTIVAQLELLLRGAHGPLTSEQRTRT
jgi:hypothetical protein